MFDWLNYKFEGFELRGDYSTLGWSNTARHSATSVCSFALHETQMLAQHPGIEPQLVFACYC